MGWSIKKPLGSKNSVANRIISNPIPTLIAPGVGSVYTDMKANEENKRNEFNRQQAQAVDEESASQNELTRLASEEERKRQMLGQQQRQQILGFADETQSRANDFRKTLAGSLANTAQSYFQRLNPYILEDLNARGLFTSETARNQEQTKALQEIAEKDQSALRGFDTDIFGQLNDIRGSALSAQLGGDQSALDAALELRKAGVQRRFDEASAAREQSFAEMLSRRQSRDNLIGSLLGIGGRLGLAGLGG